MNRREAITALTALPAVAGISVASLRPRDVIVIMCDGEISDAIADRIKQTVQLVWPDNKVLVLGDGLQMRIVKDA